MTVAYALSEIKKVGMDKETIYTCYVIDAQRKLIGVVPLRTLICADDDATVGDLMQDDVLAVNTLDDQEEVANIFKKFNWMALPVTYKEGRMVGIITVDDIVDVIEQETTEDMELMNAVLPSDDEYLKMSVIGLAKNRIPWLCVLMISGTLSAFVIGMYQELLDSVVVLSSFMTIITGTGGNAGSQASAMIIRGLALGEIQMRDTMKVVFKELRVGAICGLVLAIVNMIRMTFFDNGTPFNIDLTVSISMGVAVILAKTLGCSLPILAKAVKLDPAMMAGPLITTVVDAIALVVYFSIATTLIL
ncbi:MAG: magnesium transporter, partial [Anaerotignum sp.]|nr:magnesium transporter [Anaerotignum sp.]